MKLRTSIISMAIAAGLLMTASVSADAISYDGPMTVEAGETEIDFSTTADMFESYTVNLKEQGTIVWSGEETGTKDFSWNIETPESITPDSSQAYINFPGKPTFADGAKVTLISPLANGTYLYSYSADGGYVNVNFDKEEVNGSDCFVFTVKQLAETYVFSSIEIASAANAEDVEEDKTGEDEEVPKDEESTETEDVSEAEGEESVDAILGEDDNSLSNPNTGVFSTNYTPILIACGIIGICSVSGLLMKNGGKSK